MYLAVTSGLQVYTKVWEGHPEVHVSLVIVPRLCAWYVQLLATDPKARVGLQEGWAFHFPGGHMTTPRVKPVYD